MYGDAMPKENNFTLAMSVQAGRETSHYKIGITCNSTINTQAATSQIVSIPYSPLCIIEMAQIEYVQGILLTFDDLMCFIICFYRYIIPYPSG